MVTRIYIPEIQADLQYKDARSVVKWCKRMGVRLFTDKGCKKQWAIKEEYQLMKNYQAIEYLKQKYPNENLTETLQKLYEIFKPNTENQKTDIPITNNQSTYIPQFEYEKKMVSIFTNL